MALHFSPEEFARRRAALLAAMAEARLDGLLLFQQESMYWLTGYDTFGFCFFQGLAVTADGRMALLTRSADLRQAQHTSTIEDIRIWKDAAGANPALDLKALAAAGRADYEREQARRRMPRLLLSTGEVFYEGLSEAGSADLVGDPVSPGVVEGQARVVLEALKRYGMILADNGSSWFVSGAPDPHWSNDDLHTLGRVHGSDFEVVDASSLQR